jgi:hypothetical protein
MTSLEARADALFEDLPTDPSKRVEAVAHVYALLRERASRHLEPAIVELLNEGQGQSYEAKRELVRKINYSLHDARLAFVNPTTQLHACLVPNPQPRSQQGRFRLKDSEVAEDGKRHNFHIKPSNSATLRLDPTSPTEPGGRRQR